MNTFRILFFITCLFVTPFALLEAQTTTASSTETGGSILDSVIQNVSEIKENVQEKIQGTKPGNSPALKKATQKRIINLAANISNRFEGIIARLENISDRLNKRIEKQSIEGYNVSAAKATLENANNALRDAKNQMSDIDTAVTGAIGSTDPRTEWKKVRIKFTTARDSIKTAHTELKNTVANLKVATQNKPVAATSTTSEKSSTQ